MFQNSTKKIRKSSLDDSVGLPKVRKPAKIRYSESSLNSTNQNETTRTLRSTSRNTTIEQIEKEPSRMTLRNRTLDNSSVLTQSTKHQTTKSNAKEKQSSKKQTSQYQAKQSSSKEENQRQTRSTTKKSHLKQAQPKPHTPRVRSKSRINTNRKKPFNRSKSESDAITSFKSNKIEKPITCPKITKKKTRK